MYIRDIENIPWYLNDKWSDYILEVDYDKKIGLIMRIQSDTGQCFYHNIIVEDTAANHKIINVQMKKQEEITYDNGWEDE